MKWWQNYLFNSLHLKYSVTATIEPPTVHLSFSHILASAGSLEDLAFRYLRTVGWRLSLWRSYPSPLSIVSGILLYIFVIWSLLYIQFSGTLFCFFSPPNHILSLALLGATHFLWARGPAFSTIKPSGTDSWVLKGSSFLISPIKPRHYYITYLAQVCLDI